MSSQFAYEIFEPEKDNSFVKTIKNDCWLPFTNKKRFINKLVGFFPIFEWLPKYDIKECLLPDFMGGVTAGVIHVTQGTAYAILCGVPPVNGLYSSLLAPLIYMFFGTSIPCSLGTFAILALMTGDANREIMAMYYPTNSSEIFDMEDNTFLTVNPSSICLTLTFTMGILQIAAAILKFEYLTSLFTDPLVGGFTAAAAIHVFFAQVFDIIGVKNTSSTGFGYLLNVIFHFFKVLPQSNFVTLSTSIVAALILIFGKDYISPIIRKCTKGRFIMPFELLVVS
uniref:SLC26A/SulP transporter domain-containing protein n=1 Tax=Panagrolaimus sp. JU765 TaxID=591449 RepID=A0AC34Q3N8_9BILA